VGRKPVAQRYAMWVDRIYEHYEPGIEFSAREALSTVGAKYNSTYYPNARSIGMVLRLDDRFGRKKNLNNNLSMWYVRR